MLTNTENSDGKPATYNFSDVQDIVIVGWACAFEGADEETLADISHQISPQLTYDVEGQSVTYKNSKPIMQRMCNLPLCMEKIVDHFGHLMADTHDIQYVGGNMYYFTMDEFESSLVSGEWEHPIVFATTNEKGDIAKIIVN